MGFFNDMAAAIEDYPVTDMTVQLVNVASTGTVVNINDEGTFSVKVTNNGGLNVRGLKLRVDGQNGAKVMDPTIVINKVPVAAAVVVGDPIPTNAYGDSFTTGELAELDAHTSKTFGTYKWKAPPSVSTAAETLLKVTIAAWDANLDHLLTDHSNGSRTDPKDTYSSTVQGL